MDIQLPVACQLFDMKMQLFPREQCSEIFLLDKARIAIKLQINL